MTTPNEKYLADRDERLKWARKEAGYLLVNDCNLVAPPRLMVELVAARLNAAYLKGATDALKDETAYILAQAGSRPVRATAPAQRAGEAGAESEPDATGFSGTPEPER